MIDNLRKGLDNKKVKQQIPNFKRRKASRVLQRSTRVLPSKPTVYIEDTTESDYFTYTGGPPLVDLHHSECFKLRVRP